MALDGGEEGMDIITHILTLAPRLFNVSGYGRHLHFHCVIDVSWQSCSPASSSPDNVEAQVLALPS